MIWSRYHQSLVFFIFLFFSLVSTQEPVAVDDTSVYSLAIPSGIQFNDAGWSMISPGDVG